MRERLNDLRLPSLAVTLALLVGGCTGGQEPSVSAPSPVVTTASPFPTATIPKEFLSPSPTPSPSPEDVTLELYGAELVSTPWVGTMYWKCERKAGSSVTRFSTTVVNNIGATITASYGLSSGRTASRLLNTPRHLSTPMTEATLHVWEVEWYHKPGRIVTTISVDFTAMAASGVCHNPPLTNITIVRS